jgi:hypothetical protein
MSMFKYVGLFVAAAVVALMAQGAFAEGAAASHPANAAAEIVSVVGTVGVVKSAKNEVEGVTITTTAGATYHVVQNAEGKMLAKDEGKKVDAKGSVMEREGKKWLHVKSCMMIPEAAK